MKNLLKRLGCSLGFHKWEEPFTVLHGSCYSLWYYCKNKNCDRIKVEDYALQHTNFLAEDSKEKYKKLPNLISKSIFKDPFYDFNNCASLIESNNN